MKSHNKNVVPVNIPARVRKGGKIKASQINAIVDASRLLSNRGIGLPVESARRPRQNGFTARYDAASGEIVVSAGWYTPDVNEPMVRVLGANATGQYAYLIVGMHENSAINANAVSVSIEASALDPITVSNVVNSNATYASESNILLASFIDNTFSQHRSGDFLLTTWAITGYAAKWPETIIGAYGKPDD